MEEEKVVIFIDKDNIGIENLKALNICNQEPEKDEEYFIDDDYNCYFVTAEKYFTSKNVKRIRTVYYVPKQNTQNQNDTHRMVDINNLGGNFGNWLQGYSEVLAFNPYKKVIGCIYCINRNSGALTEEEIEGLTSMKEFPILIASNDGKQNGRINGNDCIEYVQHKNINNMINKLIKESAKKEEALINKVEEVKKKLIFKLPLNIKISSQADNAALRGIIGRGLNNLIDNHINIRGCRSVNVDELIRDNIDASRLDMLWYGIDCDLYDNNSIKTDISNIIRIINNNRNFDENYESIYKNLTILLVSSSIGNRMASEIERQILENIKISDQLNIFKLPMIREKDREEMTIASKSMKDLIFMSGVAAASTDEGLNMLGKLEKDGTIKNIDRNRIRGYITNDANFENGINDIVNGLNVNDEGFRRDFKGFTKRIEDKNSGFDNFNVVVMGKTGVGKSSLINAIGRYAMPDGAYLKAIEGHKAKPETQGIIEHVFPAKHIKIFDTGGLELETPERQIDAINEFVKECSRTNNPNQFIHAIWYCVSATSGRLEEGEIKAIKHITGLYSVNEGLPVIGVITKYIDGYRGSANAIEGGLNDIGIKNVVKVLARKNDAPEGEGNPNPYRTDDLDNLLNTTYRKAFDKSIQNSIAAAVLNNVKRDLKMKSEIVEGIINDKDSDENVRIRKRRNLGGKIKESINAILRRYDTVNGNDEHYRYFNQYNGQYIDFEDKREALSKIERKIKDARFINMAILGTGGAIGGAILGTYIAVMTALLCIPGGLGFGFVLTPIIAITGGFSGFSGFVGAVGAGMNKNFIISGCRDLEKRLNNKLSDVIFDRLRRQVVVNPFIGEYIEEAKKAIAKRFGLGQEITGVRIDDSFSYTSSSSNDMLDGVENNMTQNQNDVSDSINAPEELLHNENFIYAREWKGKNDYSSSSCDDELLDARNNILQNQNGDNGNESIIIENDDVYSAKESIGQNDLHRLNQQKKTSIPNSSNKTSTEMNNFNK